MTHARAIRLSAALLAVLALGCTDEEPTSIPASELFEVSPLFIGIDPGATQQMTATLGGEPVAVTWESSNTAVATVSASGLVTALTAGFAAVTATMASDPTKLVSGNITVLPLLGIGLTNGVAVGPLASSAARGTTVLYRIFVPPGKTNLTVTLDVGAGDADLYVRRQTPPTTSSFTCASENGTATSEICSFSNPASGTWYIVIALWDPYSGASLKATYTP